jgi:hypothetical protein
MPQLVGSKCVTCQQSIPSVMDGAFCPRCGNPAHKLCLECARTALEGKCEICGGDPNHPLAIEVQRERDATGVHEKKEKARSHHVELGPFPISVRCPKCDSNEYKRVSPNAWVAFI